MVKGKENKARGRTVTELLLYMEQRRKDSAKGQEPTGREGVNLMAIWRESVPGRQNSKYKGPEAGMCLECVRSIQEPSWRAVSEGTVVGGRQTEKGQFT